MRWKSYPWFCHGLVTDGACSNRGRIPMAARDGESANLSDERLPERDNSDCSREARRTCDTPPSPSTELLTPRRHTMGRALKDAETRSNPIHPERSRKPTILLTDSWENAKSHDFHNYSLIDFILNKISS